MVDPKLDINLQTFKDIIRFSLPIILGHLGFMLIGAGDVWVAAKHSDVAIAAVGISNGLLSPIHMLVIGMNYGISPMLSNWRGQGDNIEKFLPTCLAYSIIYSIPMALLIYLGSYAIPFISFEPQVEQFIVSYIKITSFSIIFVSIYSGIKEFLQAKGQIFWPNLFSVLAIFVNIFFNYQLVFGSSLFPKLGVDGLAWASNITRFFLMISILFLVRKELNLKKLVFIKDFFIQCSRFSYPISFAIFFEVFAFSILAPLIGKISTLQAAAHNVVITIIATFFMIPLAISSTLSTKIGFFKGQGDLKSVKNYIIVGLICTQTLALIAGLGYWFKPQFLINLFTSDPNILPIAGKLFIIVAVFQFFDYLQVALAGILRGLGISKPALILNLMGYWIIGIPLGIYLGFVKNMQAEGLWWSLAVALILISLSLSVVLIVNWKKNQLTAK